MPTASSNSPTTERCPGADEHHYAALVAADQPADSGNADDTHGAYRGPQDSHVCQNGDQSLPKACDDGPFGNGNGTGGQLRYTLTVPAAQLAAKQASRQSSANADLDSAPTWSPDGTRIAFEHAAAATLTPGSSTEPEQKDILVMNADGSDVQQLTDSPGKDEGPVWSPDGTKIAFSSDRDGQQEIYVMNADGTRPRRLTDNPARDESADWQSLPFDTTGHQPCGDVSLAPGGASSVVTELHRCKQALRLAADWADAADDGTPPDRVRAFDCSVTDAP